MPETMEPDGPTLLVLVGPPAVGKMTVGRAIAARTSLSLFHNHMAIDLAAQFFAIGSGPFRRIVRDVRQRIMEEAADNLPGLIFTYVWDYSDPKDREPLDRYGQLFTHRGGRVLFVELQAEQAVRLERNEGASRLEAKATKRDLAASRRNLLAMDEEYRLASDGRLDGPDYLRIDNTRVEPDDVARQVIDFFHLPEEADATGAQASGTCPSALDQLNNQRIAAPRLHPTGRGVSRRQPLIETSDDVYADTPEQETELNHNPRLRVPAYLLVGLTGSGKTTYSRRLEADGVLRLCVDEEVYARNGRYGLDYPEHDYAKRERPVVEDIQQRLVQAIRSGRSVVLDYGLWRRSEREAYKKLVEDAGGAWRLIYLKVDKGELLRRLGERNLRSDANALPVTPRALDDFYARFEEPVGEGEEVIAPQV